jgi:hypothetical protein
MMGFNLDDYEDVATLNKWFISNFPMGRSDISVVSHDAVNGFILFKLLYGEMQVMINQQLVIWLLDQRNIYA